jgi:hypothetical protein
MGAMKDLYGKLVGAFPSTCPHCHTSLASSIDLNKLNEVIDEITLTERLNGNHGQLEWQHPEDGYCEGCAHDENDGCVALAQDCPQIQQREVRTKVNDYWKELHLEEQRLQERS